MSLGITFAEVRRHVGRLLGFGADPDSYDSNAILAVDDAIRAGLRDFYFPSINGAPYEWSFLRKLGSITFVSGTAAYTMPSGFVRMASRMVVSGDSFPLRQLSDGDIRSMSQALSESGDPLYFAIVPDEALIATGVTAYKATFYPVPNTTDTVRFWHTFSPTVDLDTGGPIGGVNHGRAIIQCCLAQAEIMLNLESIPETGGLHISKAEQLLSLAIESDRDLQMAAPPVSAFAQQQPQG
jgi:hypothetical protein